MKVASRKLISRYQEETFISFGYALGVLHGGSKLSRPASTADLEQDLEVPGSTPGKRYFHL